MLARILIGLVFGAAAALMLVPAVLFAGAGPDGADLPVVLAGTSLFAGVGIATGAETRRRAFGMLLAYVGLAGAAASVVGHMASLDWLPVMLTLEERSMARMNGTMSLLVGACALVAAAWITRASNAASAGAVMIDENRDYLKGLNVFVESEIRGWLRAHERDVLFGNRWRRLLLVLGLPLTVAAVLLVTAYYRPMHPPLWLTAVLALAALGMFCVAFGPQVETSTSARNEIIRRLCRFFGLQLNDKGNGIDLKPFRRLHMVPGYQRVRLNHVLWSRASGYDLQMTEATLQARRSRRLPLMHPYRVLFHGILVSFRIPDKVDSDLILLSHKRHAELASKGETLRSVQSGHPALDKTFKIVATKPAAAARLLSQPVADVLMRNAEALDSNALQCAISGDRIYFTMATKRRWFGGSRSTDFVDIGEIRHFVADIAAVFELAHAARTIADGAAGRSVMTQAPSEPSVPAALATPGLSAA